MKFTFDSSGTGQQQQWAKEAILSCSYDLSLLPYTVNVVWADPLPLSDSGHLHSYMVTKGSGSNWTIYIEKWADDPTNPNNQGLPDPANDIFGFYKEAFVHELGHVVSESLLNTDALVQQACGLFWTPDMNGGSGMRYGTLNDWNPTAPWAELIIEAVAEQFKIVYYTGQLIFRNRTIWRLPQQNWPSLWKLLMPPLKGLFQGDNSSSNGSSGIGPNYVVPTQFGVGYLQSVTMFAAIGPIVYTGPTALPGADSHGGTYNGGPGLALLNPNTGAYTNIAAAQVLLRTGYDPFGVKYNFADWSCELGVGGTLGGVSHGSFAPGAATLEISVSPGVNPGDLDIVVTGPTGQSSAVMPGVDPTNLLIGTYNDGMGFTAPGDVECPASFVWGLQYSAGPPPYPGGPDGGDIAVGLGYRGAVILGQ